MTNDEIATLVAEYDYRVSLGIEHDRRTNVKMEQYRISLGL